jgi:hypothetical protein
MTNSSRRSSKSKSSRCSSKITNKKITKTLLQKVLKNKGRGKYANELIRILLYEIMTRNTAIEVTLTMLLPKEISYIMITLFRAWGEYEYFKRKTEQFISSNVILPVTEKVKNNILPFILPKIKFSVIESCIVLLSKLIISLAITIHQPKSYIIKLRKDLVI